MKTITQIIKFRASMLKHGSNETAKKYQISRPTVYRQKRHYDGTQTSLKDHSH